MFKTLRQPINIVFFIQVVLVFLVAFGILPRIFIISLAVLVAIFVLWADLEISTAFFIRSIPLFVAIPITSYFDSFNIWRIASGLIFLKWFYSKSPKGEWEILRKSAVYPLENSRATSRRPSDEQESGELSKANPESRVGDMTDLLVTKFKSYPLASFLIIFLLTSCLSLLAAEDLFAGVKRIIYLINLSLVPMVIYDLVKKNPALTRNFLANILISGAIVAGVGVAQLVSAYLISLDAFLNFWGGAVQLGFYGSQWSNIALEANTWFAYFVNQLSLRVFSTLTDSHSFPIYLLMTIPSLLSLALYKVFRKPSGAEGNTFRELSRDEKYVHRSPKVDFKKLIQVRASWLIILLPIFYLLVILSGTRGIWLAVLGPFLVWPFLMHRIKNQNHKSYDIMIYHRILKTLGLLLIPFLILFVAALPIMGSDQFGLEKGDNQILGRRIRSIIDLEETSNSGRLEIWQKTISSIIRHPLSGVGIGNFPTVLAQHPDLAKAGSSAHNLYLNIAAEIGLVGLLAALGILRIILKRSWDVFLGANQPYTHSKIPERRIESREWVVGMTDLLRIYSAALILYSLWVLFYSLTDAVLFDERAFLIFAVNSAIILGLYKAKNPQGVQD